MQPDDDRADPDDDTSLATTGADDQLPAEVGAHALLRLFEQQQRDSAANRAQARELIRSLDQLQQTQEYLGRELRRERTRSRWLLAAVPVAAVAGAVLVALLWRHVDEDRRALEERVASVETLDREQGRAELRAAYDERVAGLREQLQAAEEDLRTVRSDDSESAAVTRAREAALAERVRELEAREVGARGELAELAGLRARVEAYQEVAGAESARAAALMDEIRRLEREAGRAAAAADAPSRPIPAPERFDPVAPPSVRVGPSRPATAAEAAPTPTATTSDDPVDRGGPAAEHATDLDRIRTALNGLLELSPDAVRYRIVSLGGVRGHELLDVRVVGEDESGRKVRRLEADRAQLRIDEAAGTARLAFEDGALLVAGRRAPFYDGRYNVVTTTDVGKWRASDLTCVRFE